MTETGVSDHVCARTEDKRKVENVVTRIAPDGFKIVAIVPAHNEEDLIEATLVSLIDQTRTPDKIMVMADNCTDATLSIVRQFVADHPAHDVGIFETMGNQARKAGALNQALAWLDLSEWDFVLQMDADTELDLRLIEEGLKEFERDPGIGGVASRCFPKPAPNGTSARGRMLWKIQNIEYGIADSRHVQRQGKAKVLAGAVCLYRLDVLIAAANLNHQPENAPHLHAWPEESLVEDYEVTLNVQKLGYKTEIGLRMFSFTDAMFTFRDLKNQRFRWYGGTAAVLKRRGFAPEIRMEALVQSFYVFVILSRILLIALLGSVAVLAAVGSSPVPFAMSWWMAPILGLILINYLYRFQFVRNRDAGQWLLVLTLIPIELYITWDQVLTLFAYGKNLVRPSSAW